MAKDRTPAPRKNAPAKAAPRKKGAALVKRGPPSSYTEALGNAICERLAAGESLRSICAERGQPAMRTVLGWLEANEGFRAKYTRARQAQADTVARECIDIIDEPVATELQLEHATRRVETRKWYAAKLRPKVYGEAAAPGVAVQVNNNRYEASIYAGATPPEG